MSVETHYPRIDPKGKRYNASCSCGWRDAVERDYKQEAERQWAAHATKTLKKVTRPKIFLPK